MKADSTVRKELRRLRQAIDSPDTDNLTKRVAYEVEQAIRWAREDAIKGWPTPLTMATGAANLIRQEIKSGDIRL